MILELVTKLNQNWYHRQMVGYNRLIGKGWNRAILPSIAVADVSRNDDGHSANRKRGRIPSHRSGRREIGDPGALWRVLEIWNFFGSSS